MRNRNAALRGVREAWNSDPRIIEYGEALKQVDQGIAGPREAHERYKRALAPYALAHAEMVDTLLAAGATSDLARTSLMRSLYDVGRIPIGVIAVAFRATDVEVELLLDTPVMQEEPEDEVTRLAQLPYKAYLRTEHWKQVRDEALERAEKRCQLCASTKHLQVHHRDYTRKGRERPADLFVMCDACHARHHDKKPKRVA